MPANVLLNEVLRDEALTRGLGDAEARILIEWLVEGVEQAEREGSSSAAQVTVAKLRRRGRAISRFVGLWCHEHARAGALQLAGSERFRWPLPVAQVDPCELMEHILTWETQEFQASRPAA